MTFPDLAFIETARQLEVEAVEGGRTLAEFTSAPGNGSAGIDEAPILGRAVDGIEETGNRCEAVRKYLEYARRAFDERCLAYPFDAARSGDALVVLAGQEKLAKAVAELSSLSGRGDCAAKNFEVRAFTALHALVGGWAICVGAPRKDRSGPKKAIGGFRKNLLRHEKGPFEPKYAPNGDHGADGFVVLGRTWGGPLVFFQCKNTSFSIKKYPEELARIPSVVQDWFGKNLSQHRRVVPVLAMNTVLTLEMKDLAFQERGQEAGVHIIDAVDILGAEFADSAHPHRRSECVCL
jgi:hypothetical protein